MAAVWLIQLDTESITIGAGGGSGEVRRIDKRGLGLRNNPSGPTVCQALPTLDLAQSRKKVASTSYGLCAWSCCDK